jgi:hypothetical protein
MANNVTNLQKEPMQINPDGIIAFQTGCFGIISPYGIELE